MKNHEHSQNETPSALSDSELRLCPKCKARMIEGRFGKTPGEGRLIWSCTNYPKCGYTEMPRTADELALLQFLKLANEGEGRKLRTRKSM